MREKYKRRPIQRRYLEILAELQARQNEVFWQLTADHPREKQDRDLILPYIVKFVEDHSYQLEGFTEEELSEKLYNDLREVSILTAPLADPEVEGIRIDAWDNVTIDFADGFSQKTNGFNSPQHAVDIINTRLLQDTVRPMDDAVPAAEGSLGSSIRITALKSPVADASAGVACYIRKLSARAFTEQDYLLGGFAAPKELRMLQTMLRRGCSILLVGKVNTGKTTLLASLLSTLPDNMQIVTIEEGAREMNLVRYNEDGEPANNVIHLLTKKGNKPEETITQEFLLERTLRLNPDVVAMAEMRNMEAHAAVEASLSGHVVISTTHAGSPRQAHSRVANLCRKKYPMDFRTALRQACEAFPVVAFIHTLEDKKRRIMNLSECLVDVESDRISYNTLWRYQVEENTAGEGRGALVKGRHVRCGAMSRALVERMKMYGLTALELEEMEGGE